MIFKIWVRGLCRARRTMQEAPAADRNKEAIREVLQRYIPCDLAGTALEVASGTGQHVAHFAQYFPHLSWQPSDVEHASVISISAYIDHYKLQNVKPALCIDITTPVDQWEGGDFSPHSYDVIVNSNMVHISPWATAIGLFDAAGYLLKSTGFLFTYGPYANNSVLEPYSNVRFDQSLKKRNPEWGIRDIQDLKQLADKNNFSLTEIVDMPANNKTLVWKKNFSLTEIVDMPANNKTLVWKKNPS